MENGGSGIGDDNREVTAIGFGNSVEGDIVTAWRTVAAASAVKIA